MKRSQTTAKSAQRRRLEADRIKGMLIEFSEALHAFDNSTWDQYGAELELGRGALAEAIAFLDDETHIKRRVTAQDVKDARFDELWSRARDKLGHRATRQHVAAEVQRLLGEEDDIHQDLATILDRADSRTWPDATDR